MSAPDFVIDKNLWVEVKKIADTVYKKHSAYKSGFITKLYKQLGGKFRGNKKNKGLTRWLNEKWTNPRGETGYKYKSDIYRPTIRIDKNTPITYGELTNAEIKRAKKVKAKTGRVKKFKI